MEKKEIKIVLSVLSGLLAGYFLFCMAIGIYAMHTWAKDEEKTILQCMQKTGHTYEQCESAVVW